jgi:hypothetical protein
VREARGYFNFLIHRGAQMHDPNELNIGTRIRFSPLGKERLRRHSVQTGKIVGRSVNRNAVRVLLDGKKQPISLHVSYVEPESS